MERSRAESSSPLATIEDIQRRLFPPSSTLSSPDNVPNCNSSQFKLKLTEFQTNQNARETKLTKNKLEDYLDPVLLSASSTKLNRVKKESETKMKKAFKDFEWPVDELKILTENSRTANRVSLRNIEALDLSNDLDLNENVEDEDDTSCSPFRQFERTALKRFEV